MSRIGLLMRKIGCTTIFDDKVLSCQAVTVLYLEESCIISICKGSDKSSVKVGFGRVSGHKLNKAQWQMFSKLNVECKNKIMEFKVCNSYADILQVSQQLSVDHFKIGQHIDAIGKSIGKGFVGVMKRHNFSGLARSHGVSISHRSQGSTGQCQDPGKIFKGKKMAGHLGNSRITIQNLRVVDLDVRNRLLIVSGAVPGSKGGYVLLRDAIKKRCFG